MTRSSSPIRLGYAVGSGEPVDIPLRHMAVTGQTQESGKTTTLEALAERATEQGVRVLAFVTKRGEGAFADGWRVRPYFRDRADWQFVTSIIDATLQEKNKFLRPWIMKICRTTRSLADVQSAVRNALKTAKGINEGVYTQLDEYLELIVPEIRRADLAPTLSLAHATPNVMDVSGFATPMQMLFVQSAIDWVNEHETNTVVIVPEAWEFIPEGKGSPVKASAVSLVRKGAGIGNYIWVDSQDMAGVDKVILRGCAVWLIGVQREANEIKRNLANIPTNIRRPKPAEIAMLDRGEFYACWGNHSIKTYVQPAWLGESDARGVATRDVSRATLAVLDPARARRPTPVPPEDTVNEREAQQLRDENAALKRRVAELAEQIAAQRDTGRPDAPKRLAPSSNDKAAESAQRSGRPASGDAGSTLAGTSGANGHGILDEDLYLSLRSRLIRDASEDPTLLRVLVERPEIQVAVTRAVIEVDGDSRRGRIARLIVDGFFNDGPKTSGDVLTELARRGHKDAGANVAKELGELARLGFFTKSNKWHTLVPDMRVNVVER